MVDVFRCEIWHSETDNMSPFFYAKSKYIYLIFRGGILAASFFCLILINVFVFLLKFAILLLYSDANNSFRIISL